MLAAAGKTENSPYYISSGYRDYTEQKKTYDGTADKSYVQPPGHSEHETGLAADIMVKGLTQYIAKSLTELMGGRLDISINGDLFGVEVSLPSEKL